MFKELNPFFFSKNPLNDLLEDLYEIFLENKQPQIGKGKTRAQKLTAAFLFSKMGKFHLKRI